MEIPEIPEEIKSNKFKITKVIITLVVAYSVDSVIIAIVRNNMQPINKRQKLQLFVGSHVLGAMVADKAVRYVENELNDYRDSWIKFKNTGFENGKNLYEK